MTIADIDEKTLQEAGKVFARAFPNFYGYLKFNLQGGSCPNVNVHRTVRFVKPEQQEVDK